MSTPQPTPVDPSILSNRYFIGAMAGMTVLFFVNDFFVRGEENQKQKDFEARANAGSYGTFSDRDPPARARKDPLDPDSVARTPHPQPHTKPPMVKRTDEHSIKPQGATRVPIQVFRGFFGF